MRQEDISYLVRHNIPVTKYNIDNINLFNSSRTSIKAELDSGTIPLDIAGINSIYDYVTEIFALGINIKRPTRTEIQDLTYDIDIRIENINRALDELKNEISASVVLENAMAGQTKTLLLTFDSPAILSDESDGVVINNNRLYADTSNSKVEKSQVRLEKYPLSSLEVTMRSKNEIFPAKIEGIAESGIGYKLGLEELVINADQPFRIEGTVDAERDIRLDLVIDRQDTSVFNQIELSLSKAHLVSIYTSNNNEEFTVHTPKPRYIFDSSVQIGPTSDRYVKIIFHKKKRDNIVNGNDIYSVLIRSLSLVKTTFNGTSVFVSNPLDMSGSYEKLALSACDSITYSQNADIDYYISLNGKQWQAIRPTDRFNNEDLSKDIVINTNSLIDNRFILLEDKAIVNEQYEYSLALPQDFVRTNEIRFFGKNITVFPEDWVFERGMYSAIGILYSKKEIDFGPEEVLINGRWVSGKVILYPDIHRIYIRENNYANVILDRSGQVTDLGSGEYAIDSADGNVRTVYDPLHPYNHKHIIETYFDYVFKKELIENIDYNIYNKDSNYFISTTEDQGTVMAGYRLYQSNINSVQIKAELKSMDHITIPFIEKIIIRLA